MIAVLLDMVREIIKYVIVNRIVSLYQSEFLSHHFQQKHFKDIIQLHWLNFDIVHVPVLLNYKQKPLILV